MFSKFLQRVRAFPPRPAEWTNRLGPAALVAMDGNIPRSGRAMYERFTSPTHSRDCDHYSEVQLHDGSAEIEFPPETVSLSPTLNCGVAFDGEYEASTATTAAGASSPPPTEGEWYTAASEASTELFEKGYTVVNMGGDGSFTLPMIESYKRVFPEDEVVLVHLSAYPTVSDVRSSVRAVQEKQLVKGVISVANTCASAEDRKLRKHFKMFYMDLFALHGKGIFCVRDIRNDYPVFLSIDMNVLDPAFAPGVRRPSSAGLSPREALHLINAIRGPKIAGVDIHGYDPQLDIRRGGDGMGLTEIAANKIIKESIFKIYGISNTTEKEGIERLKVMQRQGQIAVENPYPDI